MRIPRIFFLLMTTLVVSGQDTVVLRGTQRRRAPGQECHAGRRPGDVEGSRFDRCCGRRTGGLLDRRQRPQVFNNPREANGVRLAAGSYQVYPNLPRDTETATVTLIRVAPRR